MQKVDILLVDVGAANSLSELNSHFINPQSDIQFVIGWYDKLWQGGGSGLGLTHAALVSFTSWFIFP